MIKYILLVSLIILFCGVSLYGEGEEKVEARLTEIILKVYPDTIVIPEGLYTAPVEEITINSEGIRELNKKFNLVSIEKMYAKKMSREEAAAEFPEREARAPEEAQEQDLEDTFLLKFPDLIDAKLIISEYEEVEDVIYAEENMVFSID